MSVSYIPEKVKVRLWGKAAGRCQYEGCNKSLWQDFITKVEFNTAYIAHIIADKPEGPRGHRELSEELKADISNLMLMCDEHHRLIDLEDIDGHPVDRLKSMKRKHEERIELLSSIQEEKKSHILLYGANIGNQYTYVSWHKAALAMIPEYYPAENKAIELSLKNSSFNDHEDNFWFIEREHLQRQFNHHVKPKLAEGVINHLSIFALAPQPLLIELGRLLSDIPAAEVYQLHREPPNWIWQNNIDGFEYIIREPEEIKKTVVLNLSLSATVDNSRITSILGNDISIWTLTIEKPNNDFLKSREQLCKFRQTYRYILDKIKAKHGQNTILNIFPATPVSAAVEIGRVWMSKADAQLRVYDQNSQNGGFSMTLDVVPD